MEKTWMPTTGGILTIICGSVNILIAITFFIISVSCTPGGLRHLAPSAMQTTLFFASLIILTIGIVTVTGGVKALHRYSWGLALAGSILSIFNFFWFLGVASVVFIAMSRKEFS